MASFETLFRLCEDPSDVAYEKFVELINKDAMNEYFAMYPTWTLLHHLLIQPEVNKKIFDFLLNSKYFDELNIPYDEPPPDDYQENSNEISFDGYSPLAIACYSGHTAYVKILLEKGSPIVYKHNGSLMSVLPAAILAPKPKPEIFRLLIKAGADVNVLFPEFPTEYQTPLQIAIEDNRKEAIIILKRLGAKDTEPLNPPALKDFHYLPEQTQQEIYSTMLTRLHNAHLTDLPNELLELIFSHLM